MKTDEFIATGNYQSAARLVTDVLSSSVGVEMAAVIGRAGRGKTTAFKKISVDVSQSIYVRWEESTTAQLFGMLAFKLSGREECRSMKSPKSKQIIRDELGRERKVFLVDEADRCNLQQLNVLRDIHDVMHCPVILIGEEPLADKLSKERRLESRCRRQLFFEPVSTADITVFYNKALGLTIPKEAGPQLIKHADGDFRGVVNDALEAERLMKVNGWTNFNEQLLKAVLARPRFG